MLESRAFRTAVLLLLIAPSLAAQERNLQQVVPIDDRAYTYLDLVYLEAGLPRASSFRPYTAREFAEYAALVPVSRLSPAGLRMLDRLRQRIEPEALLNEAKLVGFSSDVEANLEYYTRREADGAFFLPRKDRLPMLSFPLELWFFDWVYTDATFELTEDYRLGAGRWDPITYTRGEGETAPVEANRWNLVSPELNILELDWYFPFRALISVGGPHWHLTYGREALSLGNGLSGNLLLSDFPDYYDSAILTTHWNFFKYTASYVYFEPWLTSTDRDRIDSGEYFLRLGNYGLSPPLPYKALMLHHLEMRPLINHPRLPQMTLFASEAIMFGGQYPQIRDFNPFMIFHNWFEYERTNDSFLVGFNLVPFPHLELYGQYFMNEFDTSYEGGGNFPKAYGWLGGIRSMVGTDIGVFSGFAEFVLTDPLLYNRYHPLLTFTSRRRIWSYVEPDQMIYVDRPIGYFTGPDTRLATATFEYRLPEIVEARFEYWYIEKGEKDVLSTYEQQPGATTPTGTPEISHVVGVHLSITPLPIVTFAGTCYYLADSNVGHTEGVERTDIQANVSVTFRAGKESIRNTRRPAVRMMDHWHGD